MQLGDELLRRRARAYGSVLELIGGTHNPLAPPWPFLEEVFLPILVSMGAKVKGRMERAGFLPAGGGRVHLEIEGVSALRPLELLERGSDRRHHVAADAWGAVPCAGR